MTNKLVVIINSLKVPKTKKILLYEMKFLVRNYSCLQNPWPGGYRPQIPVLCPQLNFLTPPQTKFVDTPPVSLAFFSLLPYTHLICRYCTDRLPCEEKGNYCWRICILLITAYETQRLCHTFCHLPGHSVENFTHKAAFEACFGKSREHFIYPSWFANVFDLVQFEKVPVFFLMIRKATVMLDVLARKSVQSIEVNCYLYRIGLTRWHIRPHRN